MWHPFLLNSMQFLVHVLGRMHVVSYLWTASHLCVTAWTHGVTRQCGMLLLVMGC
jgi:hypothetical protein